MSKDPWDTPAMRQWRAIKDAHPDCVLFFRMGDFYELFGDDATNLSRDLGLTLTYRNNSIPFAGVPHHQKSVYLQRAIDAGYRVAVVDQLEDPAQAKGIVDRGVTQVVTPGTLVDESLMRDEVSAHLGAIAFDSDAHAGIAIVELSTGAFHVFDGSVSACVDELARHRVRELLYASLATGDAAPRVERVLDELGASGTGRMDWTFRPDEAIGAITELYGSSGVEGFGLDPNQTCIRAAGAIVRYLRETQAVDRSQTNATSGSEFQRQRSTLAHLRPPAMIDHSRTCRIDATSARALEIEQTIREGTLEGSLVGVFLANTGTTRCVMRTPMGKRLVRTWLSSPLKDAREINTRLDAVGTLKDDRTLSQALGDKLKDMGDLARISGRLALGRATPRDLVALGKGAEKVSMLVDVLDQCDALARHRDTLLSVRDAITPVASKVLKACVDDPPAHLREGGLIRDGVDTDLDDSRTLERDAGAWLAKYQTRIMSEHDLPGLKVGYTKVFGYYIELPKAQAQRAPDIFSRKQTLKNAERFITPELKTFEDKVLSAGTRAIERERVLFDQLCDTARTVLDELGAYAHCVGELDVLLGFADKAHQRAWVRPSIDDSRELEIHQGRHPVLDEALGQRFVPNDTELGVPVAPAHLALITGPNMAGKSTHIRQCALLVVLAQSGSFVPADRMNLGVCDRVFTRVGADDALHRGQSTFMVEMLETASILNNATSNSLVILDEIGRGTSTLDGLSLAWSIVEHLAGSEETPGPRTLFATHYHEITELEERLPGLVKNLHVAVREWTNENGTQEIAFLHTIRSGRTDQSYGIHVAQLAGVPNHVTDRAREILATLSVQQRGRVETAHIEAPKPKRNDQMGLFTEFVNHPVVEEIRELKLDAMTPLDAFDALRELKRSAERDPSQI
jgi:DNA mismatch repair protein MutS